RVFGVHRVRQCEIDGVHGGQALVELVVVEGGLQTVALRDLTPLRPTAAADGYAVPGAARGRKPWQHGNLRDVPEANDCVADTFRRRHARPPVVTLSECYRLHGLFRPAPSPSP